MPRISDEETPKRARPAQVGVSQDHPRVQRAQERLRTQDVVRVRDEEGRTLFYCLTPSEYRRLRALDAAE